MRGDLRSARAWGLHGCIARMELANTASRARKISATIWRLRATAWMVAMPSTLSRRKILFMRFRMDFPTSRLRRCFVRESSDFVHCGFQELREAGGWDFMGLARQRMWLFKWRGTGASKFLHPRAMHVIKSSRWSWVLGGWEEHSMSR